MHIDHTALLPLVEQGYLTCRKHPTYDLFIYNYTAKTQYEGYWTPETRMCRGLIVAEDGTLIARPFPKFFNLEQHQDDLPLEPFKVTEKMDGSLGILYFIGDEPFIATRGSFTSEQAQWATRLLHTRYQEVFPLLRQTRQYTYLFEIIYPTNRIVVDYGEMEDLILLAVIHTETGEEYDIHTSPLRDAYPFPLVTHYDGMRDIAALRALEEANKEGFVLCFERGLRVKFKFADYVRLHRLITQVNAKTIWELLRNHQSFDEMLDRVPDEYYRWVQQTRDYLLDQYRRIEDESRRIYEQVKHLETRKEQAALVVQSPCSAVVFRMLDGKDYADIIWKQLKPIAERPFREESDR